APHPISRTPFPAFFPIPVFPFVMDGKAHGHEGSDRGYLLIVATCCLLTRNKPPGFYSWDPVGARSTAEGAVKEGGEDALGPTQRLPLHRTQALDSPRRAHHGRGRACPTLSMIDAIM